MAENINREDRAVANIITWAIIRTLTLKGRQSLKGFIHNCGRANDLSKEFLMKLVQDNRDTEYGRRFHFDQIHSVEDYKRLVPFSTYDDYAPYIERMVSKGERNLITAYPIVQYAETSGSVGVPKKKPVSAQSMEIYTQNTITRVTALADRWHREHYGKKLPIGRGFNQLEIVDRTLDDGTPLGNISGSAAKSYKKLFPYYLTSPIPVLYPKGYIPMMYLKAWYALADRDTTFMFSVFMTNLVDMMNYIRLNWETLVEDIRTGTFNEDEQIDDQTRAELMKYKITESMMDETMRRTGEELGVNIIDYSVFPNRDVSPSRYEILIESDRPLDPSKCDEYRAVLERHLGEVNPVYKECVDTNEIAHAIVYLQQMQTHALWRDLKAHKGTSLNQVKPVRVLDTPMKKKFFYGLREE